MSVSNPYEYWIRTQLAEICINEALRDIIHNTHGDPTYTGLPRDGKLLYSVLLNLKNNWEKRLQNVVSVHQWAIMCPPSCISNSECFDTTSDVVIIRYKLPGLPPPTDPNGWKVKIVKNLLTKLIFVWRREC